MITFLGIIGCIVAFLFFPIATILGLLGVWIGGPWLCLFGVIIGLMLQSS